MRNLWIILLTFISVSLNAQQEQTNRFGVKLNVNSWASQLDYFSNSTNQYEDDYYNKSRNFRLSPSFLIQNKKKNLWEFYVLSISGGRRENYLDIFEYTADGDTTKQFYQDLKELRLGVGAINHLNLAKKTQKIRAFLSMRYQLGYETMKNERSTYLYRESRAATTTVGLSFRLGYNITNQLFIEVTPPVYAELKGIFGRQFVDNPILPKYLRTSPIIDFEENILFAFIPNKWDGYQNLNGNYSNILSIGYTF